jgi:LacI family transcriptional regulator
VSADPQHRVTVADIARAAGVSVPTVSRVLNHRGDVAPQTRERVEGVIRRHGYRRRGESRRSQARLVDLVFNDLDSPWAVEIIRGVEDVARESGLGTVVSAVHRSPESVRQWLGNLSERMSSGVILVTSALERSTDDELRMLDVPTVVIDPVGAPSVEVPTIGATNWSGGLAATEHLLKMGHRRIGFIAGPSHLLCSRARKDGYRAALESAGIELREEWVANGDFHPETGFRSARELLSLPEPPTAIFASSDEMAFGAYEAVRRHGLRVPDDVSIVGFDDLPTARWAFPPLTTIRQPLAAMGMLAARTLLRLVARERLESPRVELSTSLVVRESTGPAPQDRSG